MARNKSATPRSQSPTESAYLMPDKMRVASLPRVSLEATYLIAFELPCQSRHPLAIIHGERPLLQNSIQLHSERSLAQH